MLQAKPPIKQTGLVMMPISGKGVRDALLDSEERYRSLFVEAPLAYHEIDTEGVVLRVNRAECDLLGFTEIGRASCRERV